MPVWCWRQCVGREETLLRDLGNVGREAADFLRLHIVFAVVIVNASLAVSREELAIIIIGCACSLEAGALFFLRVQKNHFCRHLMCPIRQKEVTVLFLALAVGRLDALGPN